MSRLAPLPCVRSHLCCDADEPDPTLDPEGLLLPRDIKYQATLKFRGFEPSLSLCACSFKPPAVQRRLLPSTAPLQPHFRRRRPSTALLPPVELAPLPCVSSHLYCRRRTVYLALLIGLLLWCFQDPTTHSTRQRRRRRRQQPLAAKTTEEAILPSFGPIELKLGSKIEPKLS